MLKNKLIIIMKILITWTTSWIWEYLAENLKNNSSIIWVWRSENKIDKIIFLQWDLQKLEFLEEINNLVSKEKIDFLVLNAGVWYFDKFENISLEENEEILNTNLLSPIQLTSLLLKNNSINKWIVFIWSVASKKSMKFWASYAASKFWLRGFAMQIKNEYLKLNIHLINPKIVETNFHNNSAIDIVWNKSYKETSLESILDVVKNIMDNKEKRFEIDL